MPSTAFSLPIGFSWLSPAYRPSHDEVDTYAALIAANEGAPPEAAQVYRGQAELQLWVWRTENHLRPARRRAAPRFPRAAVA